MGSEMSERRRRRRKILDYVGTESGFQFPFGADENKSRVQAINDVSGSGAVLEEAG